MDGTWRDVEMRRGRPAREAAHALLVGMWHCALGSVLAGLAVSLVLAGCVLLAS